MKNTFTLNGKTYTASPFTYNLMSDLDEMGISIESIAKKPTAFIRIYVAISGGMTKEQAGDEIEKHILAGGSLESIAEVMAKELENSDFFQKLSEIQKAKVTTTTTKKASASK